MSVFEFFTVLLSFMVSLGVATLLGAVGRLLQEAHRVRFSWAYALWTLQVFNMQVMFWVRSWSYHDLFALTPASTFPPLFLAIASYLACALATPQIPESGPIDLAAFHARQGRKYALAVAAYFAIAIVQGALMPDGRTQTAYLVDVVAQVIFVALSVLAALMPKRAWLQILIPALFFAGGLGYYARLMQG